MAHSARQWLRRRREIQDREARLEISRQIDEYARNLEEYDDSIVARTIAVLLRDNALQFVLDSFPPKDRLT